MKSLTTPLVIRASKAALVFSVGFFGLIVVFGNLTDYWTNFEFVTHVLAMDSQRPELAEVSRVNYRAIDAAWMHHVGYIGIIALEAFLTVTCLVSAGAMTRKLRASDAEFTHAKRWGIIGCTTGILIWFLGFQAVAGEWFAMWMNESWNGISDAFRLTTCIGLVLVYLSLNNDSLAGAAPSDVRDPQDRLDAVGRI